MINWQSTARLWVLTKFLICVLKRSIGLAEATAQTRYTPGPFPDGARPLRAETDFFFRAGAALFDDLDFLVFDFAALRPLLFIRISYHG